jgi:hypothetical protein
MVPPEKLMEMALGGDTLIEGGKKTNRSAWVRFSPVVARASCACPHGEELRATRSLLRKPIALSHYFVVRYITEEE